MGMSSKYSLQCIVEQQQYKGDTLMSSEALGINVYRMWYYPDDTHGDISALEM